MLKDALWDEPDRECSPIRAVERSPPPCNEMNALLMPLGDAWLSIAAGALAIGLLVWLDRNNAVHRAIVCSVAIILIWRYMTWRIFASLPEMGFTLDYGVGVTFVVVETLSM